MVQAVISKTDYIGIHAKSADLTPTRLANIELLLRAVNRLMMQGMKEGVIFPINKKTGSQIAGETYGGFRPQYCTVGAPKSAHKEGLAVDIYDPLPGLIDTWLQTSKEAKKLYEELGIYFESPQHTIGWSHWTIKPPLSGNRFFFP
ncbi:peptidase M15 [Caudoviricetes sp.]|nr:peptidase M15 [Caudoviricetes sp.]